MLSVYADVVVNPTCCQCPQVQIRHQHGAFRSTITCVKGGQPLPAGFENPAVVGYVPAACRPSDRPSSTPHAAEATTAPPTTPPPTAADREDGSRQHQHQHQHQLNRGEESTLVTVDATDADVAAGAVTAIITTAERVRAPTPGQAVAFYDIDDNVCLGGGTILQTGPSIACTRDASTT